MQPSSKQWVVICALAALVVFGWPPEQGRSLGLKVLNWAADPGHALPEAPSALPMALDDDGDAVTAHDMQERTWNDARERSAVTRWRMDLRDASDPLPVTTQRQVLVGLAVAGALAVWRMGTARN